MTTSIAEDIRDMTLKLREKGLDIEPIHVERMWNHYSECHCAQWLIMFTSVEQFLNVVDFKQAFNKEWDFFEKELKMPAALDIEEFSKTLSQILNKKLLVTLTENPSTQLLNLDAIDLDDVKAWMRSSHALEFGRYGIYDEKDLTAVAAWFIDQIRNFYLWKATHE